MADYILLMHDDGGEERASDWEAYLDGLANAGRLRDGSAWAESSVAGSHRGWRPRTGHRAEAAGLKQTKKTAQKDGIQSGRSGKRAEVFAHCSEKLAIECAVLGEVTCSSDE